MLDLAALEPEQKVELAALLAEAERRQSQRLLYRMFPALGPLRRELYTKHLTFFGLGKTYSERVFLAGNRVGKTVAAGTEWSYHLTGEYPDWWPGHTFNGPITLLASGDTHETTRDILQEKLLGTDDRDRPEKIGTGLIPGASIKAWTPRVHVKGAIEKAIVRRVSGGGDVSNAGESEIWLRSYEQGRKIFQGFELDGFWPDEECPQDVYDEGQVRLMTTKGLSTLTFTPLEGLTPLVLHLLAGADLGATSVAGLIEQKETGRAIVMCGWDDVPHLDEEAKRKLYAKLPPHQRDARTKGIPALGSGAIYPVPESDFVVDPFDIPDHWPRVYGMDVGWNRTAAAWAAIDRDTDTVYLYSEHYRGQAEPSIHAEGVKARGKWVPGVIDPAARGRSQRDGEQLLQDYIDLGLQLEIANNAVESGIYEVWQRLSTGRLKVFRSLSNWLAEYRIYRRDDKGRVVKQNDHLMDVTRYLVLSGLDIAKYPPRDKEDRRRRERNWKTA